MPATLILTFALLARSSSESAAFTDVQDNGVLTAKVIAHELGKFFPKFPLGGVGDVVMERVRYPSQNFAGKACELSGLVAFPASGAPKGLVVYYHGTTAVRDDVPSRCTSKAGDLESLLVIFAFVSGGYAVAMPDYLGLGDSKEVQPYAYGSVNSRSGIDMIEPTRAHLSQRGIGLGSRLFITGYSQGGAVAMWATRQLQAAGQRVTAAAPMSGAYDVSHVEIPAILSSQSNFVWLATRFYFAAYLGLTYCQLFDSENVAAGLSKIFVPSFATYVPYVFDTVKTDDAKVAKLGLKGFEVGAVKSIKHALQPAFEKVLEACDVSDPLVRGLVAEDCIDWKPEMPMCVICLSRDFLVPPANARNAVGVMKARGADRVNLVEVRRRGLDHITFVPLALSLARKFFDGGFAALPSPP